MKRNIHRDGDEGDQTNKRHEILQTLFVYPLSPPYCKSVRLEAFHLRP